MFRYLLLFLFTFSLCAVEESLKVRIPFDEQKKQEVIKPGNNISTEDRLQPLAKLKQPFLVSGYPDSKKDYRWTPGWIMEGTGRLRVCDASASLDGSLIAFLETTGEPSGSQGGRIVLLDVPRKRLCGYFEIGRKLIALRLGNTLNYAVAWAEEQESLKQSSGFVVMNLKTGKETAFIPSEKPYSFVVAGNILFSADSDGNIKMRNLKNDDEETLLSGPRPFLCITPDAKTLIAAADDALYYFNAKDGVVQKKTPLSSSLQICALTFMTSDASSFIFASEPDAQGRHRVFFRIGDKQKEVVSDSTAKFVWQKENSLFFVMRIIKGRVYRIDSETLKQYSSCEPKSVRPRTMGIVKYLFSVPETAELIAMDSLGAVYVLKSVGKRWRKTMIVDAGTR